MGIISIYHAGPLDNLRDAANRPESIPYSGNPYGWLGEGVYFWEDRQRCVWWQENRGYDAMIEASIDNDQIVDLLSMDQETISFLSTIRDEYRRSIGSFQRQNDHRRTPDHWFEQDADIINRYWARATMRAGIRSAFTTSQPIAPDGNLRDDCHAQVVLRDCSILRDVRLVTEDIDFGQSVERA